MYNIYTYITAFVGILLQRLFVQINNIYKIRISFEGSIFQAKICAIYFLYLSSLLLTLAFICGIIYYEITLPNICYDNKAILMNILVPFILIDIIFTVYITKIFNNKIKELISMSKTDMFTNIIQKTSILRIIITLSSIIFIITCIILVMYNIIPISLLYQLISIDLIINNICIILGFSNFNSKYNILCKLCIIIFPRQNVINLASKSQSSIEINSLPPSIKTSSQILRSIKLQKVSTFSPTSDNNITTINDNKEEQHTPIETDVLTPKAIEQITTTNNDDNNPVTTVPVFKFDNEINDTKEDIECSLTNDEDSHISISDVIIDAIMSEPDKMRKQGSLSVFTNKFKKHTQNKKTQTKIDDSVTNSNSKKATHTDSTFWKGIINSVMDLKGQQTDSEYESMKLQTPSRCRDNLKDLSIIL